MDWSDSRIIDTIAYDLVLADWPRAKNRASISDQANGVGPYSEEEVQENQINVNYNDLTMARHLQEARGQLANVFLKGGMVCRTDMGPVHKRSQWGSIVSKEVSNMRKRSVPYYESMRSKCALLALHGIAPAVWENEYRWRPKALGVDDVLIPGGTLLGFENLPFFMLRRSFTGVEFQRLVAKEKRDPGWNMPLVEATLKWVDEQTSKLMQGNWPQQWAPEKWHERMKEGGFYASDQVPTIDCFDVYAYDDSRDEGGWIRRIIFDSWGTPTAASAGAYTMSRDAGKKGLYPTKKGDFLFNSKGRKVADSWQNIISFNFADLSAVAPLRYHSVRSLGFLLHDACEIQNRMHCKFNEAVFEALMMLFKVKSMDDVQRALKMDMFNKGFIDESLMPVPAGERWTPNSNLIELGFQRNEQQIAASTGAYAQRRDFSQDKTEKTRFQVMAELNADTALMSAALSQAYQYQVFEDREIFRRVCLSQTKDVEVNKVRANIFRQGVPKSVLVPEAWEIDHERILGGGNKTLEMTIAQQLMEWRPLMDPEPQRVVLRDAVLAVSDDPARALELVPESPVKVTDSVHDAQLAMGTLMQGLPVAIKTGINHVETIETLLSELGVLVQQATQQGGMAPPDKIKGFFNVAQHISQHIQILAQDKAEKERVKKYGDALGKIMNLAKAMVQRMQQAQKQAAAQNGNGQMDPKDKAKVQAMMMQAQVKQQNAKESHADKTAQRRINFEQQTQQKQQEHALKMRTEASKAHLQIKADAAKAALDIHSTRLKSLAAGEDDDA